MKTNPLNWYNYLAALEDKMTAGAVEHGDASFDRPARELLEELEQECLDLSGWGYFLWLWIQKMKKMCGKIEKEAT